MLLVFVSLSFFFFNDTATTEIYTLSLHDALPIFLRVNQNRGKRGRENQSDDHAQNAGPGEIRIGQNQRKRQNAKDGAPDDQLAAHPVAHRPADERPGGHRAQRSEERRVGKESRSRWSPYH